jgi:type IV pilus assembly protein PilB
MPTAVKAGPKPLPPATGLVGLARALVQHGHLDELEARALLRAGGPRDFNFVGQLTGTGRLKPLEVAEFASRTFGYPLLDLDAYDPAQLACSAVDAKLMQGRHVLPLYVRRKRLALAVSDPTRTDAVDDVKFHTGLMVDPVVVEDDKLQRLIDLAVASAGPSLDALSGDDLHLEFVQEPEPAEEAPGASLVGDAPVVRFIQRVLVDAIALGASDIHFEPYEKKYRVRARVDGELRELANPPPFLKEKIAARLKVISRLDISDKRAPQDGRMKLALTPTRTVDFRVSTLPTLFGEKICLRILDPSAIGLGIESLGYEPEQKASLLEAIRRPYGMVLVTGPTGSGKTVSLYSCLERLNKPGINISTVEDPAEMNLFGVNQVNVNEKAGLTFATALRSFLRQDPDVIMVGEIRDLETAEIAIKAAQTGHLVLATLHTNDAPSTLTRMMNMGIAPFNIASGVNLITAQRLARRLCSCKRHADIPVEALLEAGFREDELDEGWQAYAPVGCDLCKGSGYRGRIGIHQVMPISEEIRRLIMKGGDELDIAQQARAEGVRDLRHSGLLKVKRGLTSLEEVMARTND